MHLASLGLLISSVLMAGLWLVYGGVHSHSQVILDDLSLDEQGRHVFQHLSVQQCPKLVGQEMFSRRISVHRL